MPLKTKKNQKKPKKNQKNPKKYPKKKPKKTQTRVQKKDWKIIVSRLVSVIWWSIFGSPSDFVRFHLLFQDFEFWGFSEKTPKNPKKTQTFEAQEKKPKKKPKKNPKKNPNESLENGPENNRFPPSICHLAIHFSGGS